MSIEKNVQIVKEFFAAIGRGNKEGLLALVAEDIEWIIPGKDWPLAGCTAGTPEWRMRLKGHPRRCRFPIQSLPNM